MDLKNIDRIEISKEQLDRLLIWRDENKDLVRRFNQVFSEALISIKGGKDLYFKQRNNEITYVVLEDKTELARLVFDKSIMRYKSIDVSKRAEVTENEKIELSKSCLTIHATLSAYICYFKSETIQKEEDVQWSESRRKKAERHNRYNTEHIIRLKKQIITIPNGSRTRFTKAERKQLVDSWNVRGHLRKLKTGKEAWVKPYTKGRGDKRVKVYKME